MVNVWGTFCPPCIAEMPDLGKLEETLQKEHASALLGIVVDAGDADTIALAKGILADASARHLNIIPDNTLQNFLSRFEYVPTTFFVDKSGHIVGETIIGGNSYDQYLSVVKDILGQ